MKHNERLDRLIAEQSSEWLEALRRDDREQQQAFARWILDSARHVRGFLLMKAFDEELRHIDPERRFAVGRVQEPAVAEIASCSRDVSVLPSVERTRQQRRRAALIGLAAGIAAVSVAGYFLRSSYTQWQNFVTTTGEQRSIELADGSIVHLNTQSRVKVLLTDKTRDIRLLEGEALFKVGPDATRPFRVYTTDARIQVLGTEFNVYRRPEGTWVAVLDGRVAISADSATKMKSAATLVGVGEEAQIRPDGAIDRRTAADVKQAAAWRERRLVFKQATLVDVVREFNRYNSSPRFQVENDEIAERRYSGVFNAGDPESLIELLEKEDDLVLQRHDDEISIRSR
jgi:transmembrane sensor